MLIVYAIALTLLNAIWWLSNVIGLPGNWLMIGSTALVAWLLREHGFVHIGTISAAIALAVVAEIIEFAMGAAGAAKSGSSRAGALGAIGGAILGGIIGTFAIPIPVIGSILGACAGAFLGALTLELRGGMKLGPAATVGRGAAIGRFWGTVAKLALGGIIWITFAAAAFWP